MNLHARLTDCSDAFVRLVALDRYRLLGTEAIEYPQRLPAAGGAGGAASVAQLLAYNEGKALSLLSMLDESGRAVFATAMRELLKVH